MQGWATEWGGVIARWDKKSKDRVAREEILEAMGGEIEISDAEPMPVDLVCTPPRASPREGRWC